ncbi:MAG: hypothetical protein QXI12_11460 [Candidatus Methanomethyliaceae archaeon]
MDQSRMARHFSRLANLFNKIAAEYAELAKDIEQTPSDTLRPRKVLSPSSNNNVQVEDMLAVINEIKVIGPEEMDSKLQEFTVDQLEAYARYYDIPFSPGRTRKDELIKKIINNAMRESRMSVIAKASEEAFKQK